MQQKVHEIAREVADLVVEKNLAYGDAFSKCGDVLRIMYPDGIQPDQYTDLLVLVRMLDKLFRVAHRKNAFGESPFLDLVGYGLLGYVKDLQEVDKPSGQ